MKINFRRSELYKNKGQLTLSLTVKEVNTQFSDELNETIASIITKKFEGENTNENT